MLAPTAGIVCPFLLNIAMAENACTNGVEFRFNTTVTGFTRDRSCCGWLIHTNKGDVETRTVVNAAGVYADELHNMVCEEKIHITQVPWRLLPLDKSAGAHVNRTIFTLPGKYGKGVLVSPTVHGNPIVGPTAIDIGDKEATATTREGLDQVIQKAGMNVKDLPMRQVITSFAGLRAHEDGHEFIIRSFPERRALWTAPGSNPQALPAPRPLGKWWRRS